MRPFAAFFASIVVGVCGACGPSQLGGSTGSAGTGGSAPGGAGGSIDIGTGIGGVAGGGSDPITGNDLTEWPVPFPDSMPFQIAATDDSVFYLTKDVGMRVGRLDVATARFTEWTTPYTATSPGDIQVADGKVFFTGATFGEIGALNVATGQLTRWMLPTAAPPAEPTQGPWSLAVPFGREIFFEADDANGPYIGILDTATGGLRAWSFPGATASKVVVAPDGSVLFTTWNGFGPYQIMRLDPTTGVFTSWPLTTQPLFPLVVADDGSVFFEEASSEFVGVARLVLSTGQLTEWETPAYPNDSLASHAGRVYFGSDGALLLSALDPRVPGRARTIVPIVSAPVAPQEFDVSSTTSVLPVEETIGVASRRVFPSQPAGAFVTWQLGTPPRMTASVPSALYFTEDAYGIIARLTP
jgi:streptogramin lyase